MANNTIQMNLLDMNGIYVSCGDTERDKIIALTKAEGDDVLRLLSTIMNKNIVCHYGGYHDVPYSLCPWFGDEFDSYEFNFRHQDSVILGYVDRDGIVWKAELSSHADIHWGSSYLTKKPTFSVSEWKKTDRYIAKIIMLNSLEQLESRLASSNRYGYEFYLENRTNGVVPESLLMSPQLEQLYKAGFVFAKRFLLQPKSISDDDALYFNRLCKRGSNLKEIFKTDKIVYTALKHLQDIDYWDIIRKLFKFGKVTADTLAQVIECGYGKRDLELINSVLGQTYNDKKVFTFNSLQNYLRRVDMYEAIPFKNAIDILNDYLRMCRLLEMEPKLDGDSLKREHDVTARTLRNKRDEIMAKKLDSSCSYLAKYNFQDEQYLIRGIESYADLIDEAKQQHNCVASYADSIAKRTSLIYVLRRVSLPNVSYVTIELSTNLKEIRQKYLAYNRPVRDKSVTDFLEKWLKHIQSIETSAD